MICYRPRSAIREVGKVFGLTEDVTAAHGQRRVGKLGRGPCARTEVRQGEARSRTTPSIAPAVELANQIIGFPRHLSQHVGGFVLTRDRLDTIVPIGPAAMEDRYFIEWDKDDIDWLGMMKVDVLALGMLTCIRKAFDLIARHEGRATHARHRAARGPRRLRHAVQGRRHRRVPGGKPGADEHAAAAASAQILRSRHRSGDCPARPHPGRHGASLSQAAERKRRRWNFPRPRPNMARRTSWRRCWARRMGVPLFQEQAMKLAIVAAKFTPEEANGLRRAMATFRNVGTIDTFREKMIEGMVRRGYAREFAERCFKQIEGFGSYGFPESHAASFAHLVYISAWIKCHHPAAFACALAQCAADGVLCPRRNRARCARAWRRGSAPDVNFSEWDNTLERNQRARSALRLGFRQIDGFHEDWARRLSPARGGRLFATSRNSCAAHELPKTALMMLAEADCLRSLRHGPARGVMGGRGGLPDDDTLPLFEPRRRCELSAEEQCAASRHAAQRACAGRLPDAAPVAQRRIRWSSCAKLFRRGRRNGLRHGQTAP